MNNQRFFIIISITIVVIVALVLGLTLGLKKHGGSGGGDSGGGGDAGGDTTSGPGPKGNEISVTISYGDSYDPRWKDFKKTLKLNVKPNTTIQNLLYIIFDTKNKSFWYGNTSLNYCFLCLSDTIFLTDKSKTLSDYKITNGSTIYIRTLSFGYTSDDDIQPCTKNCICMNTNNLASKSYAIENTKGTTEGAVTGTKEFMDKYCNVAAIDLNSWQNETPLSAPQDSNKLFMVKIGWYSNHDCNENNKLYLFVYTTPKPYLQASYGLSKDKNMASVFYVEMMDDNGTIKIYYQSEQKDWYELRTHRQFENGDVDNCIYRYENAWNGNFAFTGFDQSNNPATYEYFKLVTIEDNGFIKNFDDSQIECCRLKFRVCNKGIPKQEEFSKCDKKPFNDSDCNKFLYGVGLNSDPNPPEGLDCFGTADDYIGSDPTQLEQARQTGKMFLEKLDKKTFTPPVYFINDWDPKYFNQPLSNPSISKSLKDNQNRFLSLGNQPFVPEIIDNLFNENVRMDRKIIFDGDNRTSTKFNLYNVSKLVRKDNQDKYGDIFYATVSDSSSEFLINFGEYFIPSTIQGSGTDNAIFEYYPFGFKIDQEKTRDLFRYRSPIVIYKPSANENVDFSAKNTIDWNAPFVMRSLFLDATGKIINKNQFRMLNTTSMDPLALGLIPFMMYNYCTKYQFGDDTKENYSVGQDNTGYNRVYGGSQYWWQS